MKYVIKRTLPVIILSLFLLTSCFYIQYPYKVFIDSNNSLRVVQYHDTSEFVAIDEYYYNDNKYDDEINIDIVIPKSINGFSIKHFRREARWEILTDNTCKAEHDGACTNRAPDDLIYFSLVGFSYFDENTTFNINIDIQCDLIDFKIYDMTYDGSLDSLIYFYNNNDYLNENEMDQFFYCNLYISMTENSTKYYSKDGEVYERKSDGDDKKIAGNHSRLIVSGNLHRTSTN